MVVTAAFAAVAAVAALALAVAAAAAAVAAFSIFIFDIVVVAPAAAVAAAGAVDGAADGLQKLRMSACAREPVLFIVPASAAALLSLVAVRLAEIVFRAVVGVVASLRAAAGAAGATDDPDDGDAAVARGEREPGAMAGRAH